MLRRKILFIFACFVMVGAQGCSAQSVALRKDSADNRASDADKLLIVDCLLPGQVRKLGSSLTFLAPRRSVRTTGLDCDSRGGEYTAYHGAAYRGDPHIWLETSQLDDTDIVVSAARPISSPVPNALR